MMAVAITPNVQLAAVLSSSMYSLWNLFCGFLGTLSGNLVLTLGALGGAYIGGGIVPGLGKLFTCGGCGIWAIYDLIMFALRKQHDVDGLHGFLDEFALDPVLNRHPQIVVDVLVPADLQDRQPGRKAQLVDDGLAVLGRAHRDPRVHVACVQRVSSAS